MKRKLLKVALFTAVVVAFVYAFRPVAQNQFGPVRAPSQRGEVGAMKLPRINGGTWSLEADRGKVVLLNFWATWCPPCRMETPGLVSIHNRFVNQGFSVVGVSLDDDPKAVVPEFARKYGVPYPMVVPASGFGLSDGIESLPTSLLIDRHGKVAKTYIGMVTESALSHDVEELLKEAGR